MTFEDGRPMPQGRTGNPFEGCLPAVGCLSIVAIFGYVIGHFIVKYW